MKLPKNWLKLKAMSRDEQRAAFMRFLKENLEKTYEFSSNYHCALAQFGKSLLDETGEFCIVAGAVDIGLREKDGHEEKNDIETIQFFDWNKELDVLQDSNNFNQLYLKLTEITPSLAVND